MQRLTDKTAELANMDALERRLGGKVIQAHLQGDEAVVEVQPTAALDWYVNVWNCQATIIADSEPLDIENFDRELYAKLVWHVMESLGGAINLSGQYYPQDAEALEMFERLLAGRQEGR